MKKIDIIGIDETVYYHKTKEGLDIYVWKNNKINSKYMTLSVKYGSVDTDFKVGNKTYHVPNGTAHFLEHIKFNIDKDKTAHDVFQVQKADANAFTTFLYTSYVVFVSENISKNLNSLLDFVYNPYFTKQTISKEKPIIIEESNMGSDDPYIYSYFSQLQQVFSKSHYRNRITGLQKDINSINLDDIKIVYDTFYHPQNMFLVVTGDVNPYEIAKICDENLSNKSFSDYKNPIKMVPKEDKKVIDSYKEEYLNVVNSSVKYAIKIPLSIYKKYPKVEIGLYLQIILESIFSATSNFCEELKNEGLITSIYPDYSFIDDYVFISINADSDYPQELIERIKDKFNNLELNKEDFLRKKKAYIARFILNYDNIQFVNDLISNEIVEYNKLINNKKSIYEQLSYNNALNIMSTINNNPHSVYVLKPQKKQN